MRLIDEIEAAAAYDYEASQLMQSPWWPEIKAALLAGEALSRYVDARLADGLPPSYDEADALVLRFRAATEGTK